MSILLSLTLINVPVPMHVFLLSMQVTWCHRPAAAHPEVDADDAWWDQFMDLLLSDAKGRLMQFQCDQGSLQVRRLTPDARIPRRATQGSVGYDLFSSHDYVFPPFGKASIKTDIAVAVPSGTYARIVPRSGMALKLHIAIGASVIDQD